jgi:uncharacterized Zn-finger protein
MPADDQGAHLLQALKFMWWRGMEFTMALASDHNIIETTHRQVYCDGGGGVLGHPRVFLNMGEETAIICPYCSCVFKLVSSADTGKPSADVH